MTRSEGFRKRGIHFREDQFDRLNRLSFDSGSSTQILLSVIIDRFFKMINYKNYLEVKKRAEQLAYENLSTVRGDEVWGDAGLADLYREIQKAEKSYQDLKKQREKSGGKDEEGKRVKI